jgi:hypothetical protein
VPGGVSVRAPVWGTLAASTCSEDYDQRLDTMAARALRLIGCGAGLDEFLGTVLPNRSDAADSEADPGR